MAQKIVSALVSRKDVRKSTRSFFTGYVELGMELALGMPVRVAWIDT